MRDAPLRLMEKVLFYSSALLSVSAIILFIAQQQINAMLLLAAVLLLMACIVSVAGKNVQTMSKAVLLFCASSAVAWLLLQQLSVQATLHENDINRVGYWCLVAACWLLAWAAVEQLANIYSLSKTVNLVLAIIIPLLFGAWLLLLWEFTTKGFNVPRVLLPSPSDVGARMVASVPILWADFKQTFLKAVLIGYFIGCSAGFIVAILIDRSPFLQKGLMPIGNLVAALPIVGVAPIMVMWFGFDWQSKAAVVVVMTFFPMLVNTVSGLSASSAMLRDLMNTYAASYWQSLMKLRLPEALPFIFNALKINSTLALIGAIVAEFFGTPIVGMGFRISTEVGRMNIDMVWAEIAVAALAGSMFYGLLSLIERMLTFWHPSMRNSR